MTEYSATDLADATDDAAVHYFTAAHWRAHDAVLETLGDDLGAAALIGPTGSGKSVLARVIADGLPAEATVVTASAAAMTRSDLVLQLHKELGAGAGARDAKNKADALGRRIRQLAGLGQRVVLILEEAEQIAPEVLELAFRLRCVGRDPGGEAVGVRTLLVGGPALIPTLETPGSKTIADGLALRAHLRYFTKEETDQYLAQRLAPLADEGGDLIDRDAADRAYELTVGSPRLLSLLTGHAMLFAAERETVEGEAPITVAMIDEAAEATALYLKRAAAEADVVAMTDLPDVVELKHRDPAAARAPEPAPEETAPEPETAKPSRLERAEARAIPARGPRRKVRTVRKLDLTGLRRYGVIGGLAVASIAVVGYVAPIAMKTWEQGPDRAEVSDALVQAGEDAEQRVGDAYDTASEAFDDAVETAAVALEDAKTTAKQTYEANRGEILGVVDGVLGEAEDVARSFAEDGESSGLVKEAAAAVVENLYETRSTLEVGRVIEEADAKDPESAKKVVNSRVANELALAEQRFAAEQYTRPAGDSAYDIYLRVLRLDGRNADAHAGLKRVEEVYEGLAADALTRAEYEKYHALNNMLDRIRARRPL